jgi:cation diffusion facilitator family transporter
MGLGNLGGQSLPARTARDSARQRPGALPGGTGAPVTSEGEREAVEESRRAERAGSRVAVRAALVSLVAGVAIMATKYLAWWVTGSSAIFADAAESIVNVIAAGMVSYTVILSARPPDREHPYGHGKAESVSAAVEGTLILIAAAAIIVHAVGEMIRGPELERLGTGILVAGGAGLANLLLALYLIRVGRRVRSEALVADGAHILTDVITTVGTVGALVLVQLTGIQLLDPLVALLVAANILRTGWRVVRRALRSLLDEADFELLSAISAHLESQRRPEWVEVHQLRAWSSGALLHLDVHLMVPRYLSIEEAHRIGDAFEARVAVALPERAEATVHLDPCTPKQCSACTVRDCAVRSEALDEPFRFTVETITRPGTI